MGLFMLLLIAEALSLLVTAKLSLRHLYNMPGLVYFVVFTSLWRGYQLSAR